MLSIAFFITLVLVAFLIGSIPSGFIVGLLHGVDIRTKGSGNIGATNLKRVLGKKAGTLTLVADTIKGALAASLGLYFQNKLNTPLGGFLGPLLGTAGVYGHCFSPFLSFKGGKGVAAALGSFLVIMPTVALIALIIFAVIYKITGYVSAGSLSGALIIPLYVGLFQYDSTQTGNLIASLLITFLVIGRHVENIQRLSKGQELKT